MADVTAAAVKQLREKTGAGMMECKNALVEAEGNEEQAWRSALTTLVRGFAASGASTHTA